jgi:ABC-type dipeptide/oligopeptide/nickel transport system ATPase component
MKNLKNMLSAASLTAVMVFGAVSANAGLMISDRATTANQCTVKSSIFQQVAGIFNNLSGLMISDLNGLMISDAPTPGCTNTDGLMISDRNGLMISD